MDFLSIDMSLWLSHTTVVGITLGIPGCCWSRLPESVALWLELVLLCALSVLVVGTKVA